MSGSIIRPVPAAEARRAASEAGIREILGDTSLFQLCLRHPPIARLVAGVVETIVFASRLDARLRELAILRVGWRLGSVYEWTNHAAIALRAGASESDLIGLRDWRAHPGFGEAERAVLGAVDEALDADRISPATLARCQELFGDEALLELTLIPGLYRTVAVLLASFDVPLEPDRKPWPPDGTAPT
jgi:alkylhydroperoxidase family enzyme